MNGRVENESQIRSPRGLVKTPNHPPITNTRICNLNQIDILTLIFSLNTRRKNVFLEGKIICNSQDLILQTVPDRLRLIVPFCPPLLFSRHCSPTLKRRPARKVVDSTESIPFNKGYVLNQLLIFTVQHTQSPCTLPQTTNLIPRLVANRLPAF